MSPDPPNVHVLNTLLCPLPLFLINTHFPPPAPPDQFLNEGLSTQFCVNYFVHHASFMQTTYDFYTTGVNDPVILCCSSNEMLRK